MEIRNLYKYKRGDGGTTVSPVMPDVEYELMYRIIAGEGMAVTKDGVNLYPAIDTGNTEGWYETEGPQRDIMEEVTL